MHHDLIGHFSSGVRRDHIEETEKIKPYISVQNRQFSVGVQTNHTEVTPEEVTQIKNTMADNQNSCDSCGLLFDSPHDVQ